MIVTDKKVRTVTESAPLDRMDYFIDQKNIIHITSMLRDMYSNPVKACIREYCANAVDAHMISGQPERPIQITPPTQLSPVFKVRDFGPGLSIEDAKQLLCGFGSSGDEKRASNGFIGGFGIGAKVGFAVSSAFTYTIWHEGRKYVWSNYLDEFDASKASLLSNDPCSMEEHGIEVSVPVDPDKMQDFLRELQTAFMWYKVPPVFEGTPVTLFTAPTVVVEDVLTVVHNDEKTEVPIQIVQWSNEPEQPVVVMGGIAYPVECTSTTVGIEISQQPKRNQKILSSLVIHAPIGMLQLAPSRESLQYSQRTKTLLNKLLTKVLKDNYVTGLFKSKVKSGVDVKSAVIEAQYYADMINEDWEECFETFYPEYSGYIHNIPGNSIGTKGFGLVKELSSEALQNNTVVGIAMEIDSFYVNRMYSTQWTLMRTNFRQLAFTEQLQPTFAVIISPEQANELTNNGALGPVSKANILKRLLLYLSEGSRVTWSPGGFMFDSYSNHNGIIQLLIYVSSDPKATKVSNDWACVRDGLVSSIDAAKLLAYNPDDANGMFGLPDSRNRSRSVGRTARTAHSRKFLTLGKNYRGYGAKSDNWESLFAKDVTDDLGYIVPMNKFVAYGVFGTGVDGKGLSNVASWDDMRWLQETVLSNTELVKEILNDKPILGVRKKDYNKALEDYSFTPLWARIKEYYAGYMKDNGLTVNHFAALVILSVKFRYLYRNETLTPELAKVVSTVYRELVKSGDTKHPYYEAACMWTPYFDWAEKVIRSANMKDTAFVSFLASALGHWLHGYTENAGTDLDYPYVRDASDTAFWHGVKSALRLRQYNQINDRWLDSKELKKTGFSLGIALYDFVKSYPGILEFCGNNAPESLHKNDPWPVVIQQHTEKEISDLTPELVSHIMQYVTLVKPIKEEKV